MAASVGMQTLRGRLGAARMTLEQAAGGGAALLAISRIQARATMDLVDRFNEGLTDEERSLLVTVVMDTHFTDADAAMVIERIASGGEQIKSRRKQQDFTVFYLYMTDDKWALLLSPDTSAADKEHILFCFLQLLGLRLPSEPTFKTVTSFLMMITESWDVVQRMTVPYKKAYNSRVKANWRAAVRGVDAPTSWLQALPKIVGEFRTARPTHWASIYGAGGPVQPQVDTIRLQMVDSSFKCRAFDHGEAPAQTLPVIANSNGVVGGLGNPSLSSLEAFAGMFMKGMADMQAQQSRMAELLFSSPRPPSPCSNNRPRGLSALLEDTPMPTRRPFPILDVGGSDSASPATPARTLSLELEPARRDGVLPPQPGKTDVATMEPSPREPVLAPLRAPLEHPLASLAASGELAAVEIVEDDDDKPLSEFAKKPPTPAEMAELRACEMLDRMRARDKNKKDVKDAADKVAAVAVVAAGGAVVAADKKRGPGRPRVVKVAAAVAAEVAAAPVAKRIRLRAKTPAGGR